METKSVTCKRCGEENLRWKKSVKGKWYLTPMEPAKIRNENYRVIKTIDLAHRCEETLKERRNWERDVRFNQLQEEFRQQNPSFKYAFSQFHKTFVAQVVAELGEWEH